MKKLLALLAILLVSAQGFAQQPVSGRYDAPRSIVPFGRFFADIKITALPAASAATSDDVLLIVDNPGGVAVTKKITVANLFSASLMPNGIDAAKIGAGAVSNGEFAFLDGVTSAIQTQLNAKAPLASPVLTGQPTIPDFTLAPHDHHNAANGAQLGLSAFPSSALNGNGSKIQLFGGGSFAANDCAKFDASGNVVSAGAACGSGSGGSGTVNAGTATQVAYYASSASAVSGMGEITRNASSVLSFNSAIGEKLTSVSANYQVLVTDRIVVVTGQRTLTLPDGATAAAAVSSGTIPVYVVINGNTSLNEVTVVPAGADTFSDGSTSLAIDCINGCSARFGWINSKWVRF